jgi:hypothetical protein
MACERVSGRYGSGIEGSQLEGQHGQLPLFGAFPIDRNID